MDRNWGADPEPLDDAVSDNILSCPKCDRVFLEAKSMKVHFSRVHDEKYAEWKANLPE